MTLTVYMDRNGSVRSHIFIEQTFLEGSFLMKGFLGKAIHPYTGGLPDILLVGL